MKEVVFSPYNIVLLALTIVTCSEDESCPCVHSVDFICGWQINQQMRSNCTDNCIYKPCGKESVDAELVTKCPNECFNINDGDKLKTECGRCLQWNDQECVKTGELSTEKLKFPKNHEKRENKKFVPDYGTRENEKSVNPPVEFEDCDHDNVALEFVLILDASSSYVYKRRGGRDSFIKYVKDTMKDIYESFTSAFPNSQFGLTYFSDYNYIPSTSEDDTCYEFVQALTDDKEQLIGSASKISTEGNGGDAVESSLTALLYSAVDERMGWSESEIKDGKRVIKVLVVTTDDGWRTPETNNSRTSPEPKGDGTDTCETGVPSVELVKKVLNKKDFFIGGLVTDDTTGTWQNYMKDLGMKDRSVLKELSPDAPEQLASQLVLVLKEILCLNNNTAPEKTTTEDPGSGSSESSERPGPGTEPPDSDDLYEIWMWNLIAV